MSFVLDPTPFIAAQDRLRATAGAPVTYRLPTTLTYDPAVLINPDTQLPYDAMAQPTNSEFTEVTVTALVIVKQGSPLRPQADTDFTPIGLAPGMDIILDVATVDHDTVLDASEFVVNGLTYKLEEWKPFSLAGVIYRFLCYGQEK